MPSRLSLLVALSLPLLAACDTNPEISDEVLSTSDTTRVDADLIRAEHLEEEAQYDSAMVFYERAKVSSEAESDWEGVVRSLNGLGSCHRKKGELDQGRAILDRALEIGLEHLGERHLDVAQSHHNLGTVLLGMHRLDEALEYLTSALRTRLDIPGEHHPVVAESYNNIGLVHYSRGDYDLATDFFGRANTTREAILDDTLDLGMAGSYGNLGVVYYFKGDYDRALEFFDEALEIHLALVDDQHPDVARDYNNMGGVYYAKGDYDRALEFFGRALSIQVALRGDEQHLTIADGYNNLGLVHVEQGDYNQGLEDHRRALRIRRDSLGDHHPYVADSYHNIGLAHAAREDYGQALEFYGRALSIRRDQQNEQHPTVAETHHSMGTAYRESRAYDQALEHDAEALRIRRTVLGEQHPAVADSYTNLGLTRAARGDYDQALGLYQRALHANVPGFAEVDPYLNPPLDRALSESILLASLSAKAEALSRRYSEKPSPLSDLEAALSTYQLAADLVDLMRHGYRAEGSKLLLAENAADLYDRAIQTALRLHRTTSSEAHKEAAFRFAEKSRAGVLLDAFAEAEAREVAGIPDALLREERELRTGLAGYETNLTRERDKPLGERDSARIALWQSKLFDLGRDYERLVREIEDQYPDYYDLKYQTRTASVAAVRQRLSQENAALVEYFLGQDSLFIFTLTPEAFDVKSVVRDSLLEQQVEALRRGIITQDYEGYNRSAYDLYETLLAPVLGSLDTERLIVVPDGVLHYVPFDALLTQEARQATLDYRTLPYLIEDYTLRYAYSATLLLEGSHRGREAPDRDFIAFAPVFPEGLPTDGSTRASTAALGASDSTWWVRTGGGALPSTRGEIVAVQRLFLPWYRIVSRLFGSRTRLYIGSDATEDRVKAPEAARYRYVHLATHGFTSEETPGLSHLMLARPDATAIEDGLLHMREVYALRLNADLVVLSACQTGLGRVVRGEGIVGLTRAFLYAGAESVVVSLWSVADPQTRDLMVAFYASLRAGASKAEALRAAKLAAIRGQAKYAKPYYWAAFILVDGEMDQESLRPL